MSKYDHQKPNPMPRREQARRDRQRVRVRVRQAIDDADDHLAQDDDREQAEPLDQRLASARRARRTPDRGRATTNATTHATHERRPGDQARLRRQHALARTTATESTMPRT